ncbi:MAG: TraM recognition domain-containing protein, partial [Candidatus Competibacteraceae bacterium]|nr:TraM recognition domain-containing protein [Candidatus Competibacteraceae bacterium]
YPGQPDSQTYLQHGYLQNQFNRMFNQLADVYGHIFRAGYAEIDLTDVVLQRRILVVMLPALEKSPDELANLGKLLISSLKAMLAVGLGAQLEGSHRAVIERRPTNSPSPYVGVFDEYGYYAVKGFAVVPAQARSLGFSVCFGGQDIQSFGKQSKEEADAIVGNTLTKIAMKIEDPKDTADLFEKLGGHAIAVQTSGFTRGHNTLLSGLYRDVPNATLERRARIDPLDLRAQRLGEAHIFHGTTVIRANLFYTGEFKAKAYRLNRLVPLGPPETDLKAQQALLTPEGLRQAVACVVNGSLDELQIAQQLAVALESTVTQANGRPKDFASQFVAEYLQELDQLDAALAETFREVGAPTAASQPDEPAERSKSVNLAKPPREESAPQSADDWKTQLKAVVDDVLQAAELFDDEGVDPHEDKLNLGFEYPGLVGELAMAESSGLPELS